MKNERRFLATTEDLVSLRAEVINEKRYFTGYAAVFNKKSKLIFERGKLFFEIIKQGAFDRVLSEPDLDVILVLNHERIYNLGRTKSKNLELSVDETGLKFRALVPNTTLGNDTWEMVDRGDYTDCSFQFSTDAKGEDWIRDQDGTLLHIVREVSGLYDVTICTLHGAYSDTVVDTETISRMYNELDISVREETLDPENRQKGDESGDPDHSRTDQENEEIIKDNDLAQMRLDLLAPGGGSK